MLYATIILCATNLITVFLLIRARRRMSYSMTANLQEISKALKQAQQYSDKEGWLALKWVDRNNWLSRGLR